MELPIDFLIEGDHLTVWGTLLLIWLVVAR